ncbi:MAG: rRNA maturation RNase YbeY [Elusimicrobia bacterium]|nr:rRNA maturation RNase YbeY [Elusimicrobiota bacterium]
MDSETQINYVGDNKYLDKRSVCAVSGIVIGRYWKLSGRPPKKFKIDINVVTDNKIKRINREFLGRDRPTDVIAFSLQEGESVPEVGPPLIGQVIISRDAAERQARQLGHPVRKEMAVLLVHGLLHVAGWKEGAGLRKCQDKIVESMKNG